MSLAAQSLVYIIGGGSGAHALAAVAKTRGFPVCLYARNSQLIAAIDAGERNIRVTGALDATVTLDSTATVLDRRVANADLIFLVVTADAHAELARRLAPFLKATQIVVLCPGRTGGVLAFLQALQDSGVGNLDLPLVVEMQSLFCACRLVSPGSVDVLSFKKTNTISGIPNQRMAEAEVALSPLFSGIKVATSTLETGLENIGALLHPTPVLLNTGWIESRDGFFSHYYQAISPSVAGFIEAMDQERCAIAARLGVHIRSAKQWHEDVYGSVGLNLFETLRNNSAYASINAPTTLLHRYLLEDVSTGLVPLSELARTIGLSTPRMDAIITLANLMLNQDFRAQGRNATELGIVNLDLAAIKQRFANGPFHSER